MSVLARSAIAALIKAADDPLVITPLLSEQQLGAASVDLRLGHEFIVWRRSAIPYVDKAAQENWDDILHKSQERLRCSLFQRLILHPGELVLGATLEYLSIPSTVAASVEGRSSWGRLGIIVATATTIAPRFKGCLTLEIINHGRVPLAVYPGQIIAQLVLYRTEGSGQYQGRYDCPIGPEFTRPDRSEFERYFWSGNLAIQKNATKEEGDGKDGTTAAKLPET